MYHRQSGDGALRLTCRGGRCTPDVVLRKYLNIYAVTRQGDTRPRSADRSAPRAVGAYPPGWFSAALRASAHAPHRRYQEAHNDHKRQEDQPPSERQLTNAAINTVGRSAGLIHRKVDTEKWQAEKGDSDEDHLVGTVSALPNSAPSAG